MLDCRSRVGAALGLILALVPAFAVAEDLTVTTYYPSPRGVYGELRTTGNVGVGTGTTMPLSARLHVVQDGATAAVEVDDQAAPDTSPFLVDQNGNVGIGTTAPVRKLHVLGEAADAVQAQIEGAAGVPPVPAVPANLEFAQGGADRGHIRADATALSLLTAAQNNAKALHLNQATGNVGIGTTAPAQKLHVLGEAADAVQAQIEGAAGVPANLEFAEGGTDQGHIRADVTTLSLLTAAQDDAKALHLNQTTGNVGIGTTAPAFTLHVNGTIGVTQGGITGPIKLAWCGAATVPPCLPPDEGFYSTYAP